MGEHPSHELRGRAVGSGKAEALASNIRADLPMIGVAEGYKCTFAAFAREHPEVLRQADLIVCCTGDWAADASVEHALALPGHKAAAVFGWMEPHAVATHAVLIGNSGARFADGFDDCGQFRLPVVAGGKPPPPECGGASCLYRKIKPARSDGEVRPRWHAN